MSAFAAVLNADCAPTEERTRDRMMAVLKRHGPHATAWHNDGGVLLLHALHATHDGATLGPHRAPSGVWLTGDVRIDGQRELRAALSAAGQGVAANYGDDALVLAAWNAWGERAPERLIGEYSFVLWDPRARRLFVARDGLGLRPLYYANCGHTIIVSSLLDVVRAHPAVSSKLYDPAVLSFLAFGTKMDVERTTFADIRRLPAGHCGLTSPGNSELSLRRYWSFPDPPAFRASDADVIDGYRAALSEAVRDRLRTPVAVIPLSGGLDSTALTATARRIRPDVDILSFTVGDLDSPVDDEARLAQAVSRKLGTRHVIHEFPFLHVGLDDDPNLRTPEPVADLTHSRTMCIIRAMAAHSLVHIRGEDGDRLLKPASFLTDARRFGALATSWRALRFALSAGRLPHTGFGVRDRLRGTGPSAALLPAFLRKDAIQRHGAPAHPIPPKTARPLVSDGLLSPEWQELMESEMPGVTGLPIDSRWPLLDTRLLTFVLSLPSVPWLQQKQIVRRAFAAELPPRVVRRPKTTAWLKINDLQAIWHEQRRRHPVELSDRTGEWVDLKRARDILRSGSGAPLDEAWNVLALDSWLQSFATLEV